jgi:hypothetical protein
MRTRVFNFSAGQSSGMMTLLEKPTSNDIVLFCDTGREHPLSYKFIDDFERIEGIKVYRTAYCKRTGPPGFKGFKSLLYNRLDVPNVHHRECTKQLKVLQARRLLRSLGIRKNYDNYIGFRFDEQSRILKHKERFEGVNTVFSLNNRGIVKQDVIDFWKAKDYNLEIPTILKNCDCCFLKGKGAIIKILAVYPELGEKWLADEKKHTFIKNTSFADMLKIASRLNLTIDDLNDLEPAYGCSCTTF